MDIEQLKRFLVAAELGSLSKAARVFHITQPALTQSIKALEATFGAELFTRGAHGIRLSAFGKMLRPRAQAIVNESARARNEIDTLRTQQGARIVIGVSSFLTETVFPEAISRLLTKLPNIDVSIRVGDSSRQLAIEVEHADVDIAFVGRGEIFTHDQTVHFEQTLTHRYVLVARPQNPLFKLRPFSDKALADARWVIYEQALLDQRLQEFFEKLGVEMRHRPIRANSQTVRKALALQTDHIALLSEHYVRGEVKRGELCILDKTTFGYEHKAGLLYRRDAARTPAFKQIVTELVQGCNAAAARFESRPLKSSRGTAA